MIFLAERDVDYIENDISAIFLPLNPGGTTSVTFRPDNFALELDETIVFDLTLFSVNPSSRRTEFNPNLPNVFFQRRTVLSIQDSTGKLFGKLTQLYFNDFSNFSSKF